MMRRLLAALALLVLVVVPPWLLLVIGVYHVDGLNLLVASDARLLQLVLTVAGWLAWAAWMVALGLEVTRVLSAGRWRCTLPGLTLPRAVASALLAAALASATAPWAQADSGARAEPAIVAAATPASGAEEGTPTTSAASAPSADPSLQHRVARGDDLWSLAERYYGDGAQWRRIVEANPRLHEDPLADLPIGELLTVPSPVTLVTVRSGDTLSGLAERHLGDARRWPEIHRLNGHLIDDPDLIDVGWVLKVPLRVDSPHEDSPHVDSPHEDPQPRAGTVPSPAQPAEQGGGGTSASPDAASPDAASPDVGSSDFSEDAGTDRVVPLDEQGVDATQVSALVGGLSALTAGAVVAGLAGARALRARARPVGRRFLWPDEELARYEAALGLRAAPDEGPAREVLLDRVLRQLAAHWHTAGVPAPRLLRALVSDRDVRFEFAETVPLPDHVDPTPAGASASWAVVRACAPVDHPAAYPGLVTLGRDPDGDLVMVDLLADGVLGLAAEEGADLAEAWSALVIELACAPWATECVLHVVTDDAAFVRAVAGDRSAFAVSATEALADLEEVAAARQAIADQTGDPAVARLDPDRAEAWAPHLVVFESAPDPAQRRRLEAAASGALGLAGVFPVTGDRPAASTWTLSGGAHGVRGVHSRLGDVLEAQTVPRATRDAVAGLAASAEAADAVPAAWWAVDPATERKVNVVSLHPAPPRAQGPRLLLLGPLEIEQTAGDAPTRARRQCLEYLAWLLEHPSATAVGMARSLLVAEGTRRSNMSRLRTWLGRDREGTPYLPDAYSGRIALHPEVTSDWQELQALAAVGLNRMSFEALKLALSLVRGAPLADAAPGQWHWAEELRSDMVALIRDLGVVASRVARERGDLDSARWAANRALVAAPEDELLLVERIRTEHAAGRPDDVRRLAQRVHRTARVLGVDLLPETIDALQETIEGRLRARRA